MNTAQAIDLIELVLAVLVAVVIPTIAFVVKLVLNLQSLKQDDAALHTEIASLKSEQDAMHCATAEEMRVMRGQYSGVSERLVRIETLLELLVKGAGIATAHHPAT